MFTRKMFTCFNVKKKTWYFSHSVHCCNTSAWTLHLSACLFNTPLKTNPVSSDWSALAGLSRHCFCNHGHTVGLNVTLWHYRVFFSYCPLPQNLYSPFISLRPPSQAWACLAHQFFFCNVGFVHFCVERAILIIPIYTAPRPDCPIRQ